MQFSCDSCKATLHIGDEKVKGKRLVVRCKKCGARIQIADPALGPPPAGAAPLSSGASSPGAAPIAAAPARPASVKIPAKKADEPPRDASAEARPAPKPSSRGDLKPVPRTDSKPITRNDLKPVPRADPKPVSRSDLRPVQGRAPGREPTDTESTQAMDSGVLEQALRASKADDVTSNDSPRRPSSSGRPPPPPPPADDPPLWFAMIAGKQTGPLSRTELGLKISQTQVTPRTYLWKEGMGGWQRAHEVAEISPLFGPAKSQPFVSTNTIPPPVPSSGSYPIAVPVRDPVTQGFGDSKPGEVPEESRRGRQRVEPEFAKKEEPAPVQSAPVQPEPQKPAPKAKSSSSGKSPGSNPSALAASLFTPDLEPSRDPLGPTPEAESGDRTHVEPLPLGERVHQEAVAKELFAVPEASNGAAKDLASWASQELGRRPAAGAASPARPAAATNGATPLPESLGPTLGGAAAEPANDPFDNIPNAPGFVAPAAVDTTGNIMLRAGVKRNRTPALLAVLFGVLAVLGFLLYKIAQDGAVLTPEQAQAERQALGGTGESVSGLVKGPGSSVAGLDGQKAAPKKVAVVTPVAPVPDPAKPIDPNAASDAQAMAALDNTRGIGNHGPKADAVATPDTSKADASLSADDIKKKLGENKGALQGCIDDALRKEPNLRVGKIHIATNIAPSGVVTSAKIDKRTVDESPLGACLKRATKRIVFPAFTGDEFEVDIPILVTAGE